MILHEGIIKLDYNPAQDVLITSMPDVRQFGHSEVSYCLGLIVENIRNYDIKKLLLDSSNSVIEVEDEDYRAITTQFAMKLMSTRLKKLARVGSADTRREENSAKVSREIKQELNLALEFKSFQCKAEAMDWLLSEEIAQP